MNIQALKDNLQHIAGIVIGKTFLRWTGRRYGKPHRGSRWFSTVSANLSADGESLHLFEFGTSARGAAKLTPSGVELSADGAEQQVTWKSTGWRVHCKCLGWWDAAEVLFDPSAYRGREG